MFERARERVREFVNAASTREVIFTRGTTESINLVAQSYARPRLQRGDEILLTGLEHHANIVPWQLVAGQTGAIVKAVPMDRRGVIDVATVAAHMNERTRIVACAHVSNALGTVLPVREITRLAHARGAVVLIDGAQAVPHQRVDLKALDCDFYAFSAHKMYGPTGIGALIGRESLLEAMPPWQGGGDMILTVSFEKTTFNELPFKFEAGTPNISGAVGMAAAIDYIDSIGIENIHAHEQRLLALATAQARRRARPHHHRHRARQGRGDLLHDRRYPSARPRHDSRRRRSRGAHRPSLRHARHGVLQRARDGARLVRLLFTRVGRRCARIRTWQRRARSSADGPQGPLPRCDPRSQQEPSPLRQARSGGFVRRRAQPAVR